MMMNTNDVQHDKPLVRPATQAGRFYDANPETLRQEIDSLLALHANDRSYDEVAALIVPHAGYYYSGNVAAAAYATLRPEKSYRRIFLLGPSHHTWVDGASVNKVADYYSTPLGTVKVDQETVMELLAADSVFTYSAEAHANEHCLEVQLPFLQQRLGDVPPIVPIIVSTNELTKLKRIAQVLKPYFNEDNLFIISSDFSHYPSYDDACKVDAETGKAIESGDVYRFIETIEGNARKGINRLATSACGEFPIITLMCMLDNHYQVRHLLYQNSGDMEESDPNRVVGYHAFAFLRDYAQEDPEEFHLSADDMRQLKEIALNSIQNTLNGKPLVDSLAVMKYSPTLLRKCGAFVSLHKHGHLRGCIGHFGEDMPLYRSVAEMAKAAAFEDPRFPSLQWSELRDIDIEISVLTPMRRIYRLDEFQLHRHGIYIRKGMRSGTYLPQVADEVNWTKEEFVSHCSRDKAGLGWDGWRDAELYVYEAIVF